MSVWNISDMCLSKERQHVMLTQRVHFDILYNHHLAIIFLKHGSSQYFSSIDIISMCQKLQGFSHTLRSLYQTFTLRILSQAFQYICIMRSDAIYFFSIVFVDLNISIQLFVVK
ncbi:hypothetical protein D3C72_1722880 [compost metagenome]